MKSNALIIGGGGVGSTVGAWLEKDQGYTIDILTKPGFKEITSIDHKDEEYNPKFNYITNQSKNLYNLIIVSTKNIDSAGAHQQADNFIHPSGHIITIQSGLHDYDIKHSSHSKAVAYVNAHKSSDGKVSISSTSLQLFVENNNHEILQSLQGSNSLITNINVVDDIDRYIREKLVHISAFSGIVCATKQTIGVIREDEILYNHYLDLLDECLAVASSQGYDFDCELFKSRILNTPADVYTSLYHDFANKKSNEYSALLGKLHAIAHQNHIAVPIIDNIDATIRSHYLV